MTIHIRHREVGGRACRRWRQSWNYFALTRQTSLLHEEVESDEESFGWVQLGLSFVSLIAFSAWIIPTERSRAACSKRARVSMSLPRRGRRSMNTAEQCEKESLPTVI